MIVANQSTGALAMAQETQAKELASKTIQGVAAGAMLVMIAEAALPVRRARARRAWTIVGH